MGSELFPLLLITLLAALVPVLSNRMKWVYLPIVVGEIFAGMIIGKSGFNLVQPTPALDFLAEFGFTFLMFLSGLEINFQELLKVSEEDNGRSYWLHPIPLATTSFLLTMAMAVGIGLGLSQLGITRNGILMGLILSTTSLGIVVPVLKEQILTASRYGQVLLVSAVIGDFVTLLLLSLLVALISGGASMNFMLVMLLLAAFAATVQIGQRIRQLPVVSKTVEELSHATAQIRVRGAFALMVAWLVLSRALGIEVILGAFLAGAFMSLITSGRESVLREKLDAIGYGFFIPIFFIKVGTNFDLGALLASKSAILLVVVLIVAAYLVKIIPALLFRTLFSWRETLAAGILLSSRLSLIIAAGAVALNLNLISTATHSAIILVAVVTGTLSPVLFTKMMPTPSRKEREGTIILGASQLAAFLGERLRKTGESTTFVAGDNRQAQRLRKMKFKVLVGDPDDEQVLDQAGAPHASALIAISDKPEVVLKACQLAKNQFAIPDVIALADEPKAARQLEELGVRVVRPAMATALALEGALHFPAAFEMLMDLSYGVELIDAVLLNRSLLGLPLRKLRLPGDVLVLGVKRAGEALIPHGDTVLQKGDVLMLVGTIEALHEAKRLIQGLYWAL